MVVSNECHGRFLVSRLRYKAVGSLREKARIEIINNRQ